MNPEIKEKWLNELKSGKYKRGTGHLKVEGEVTRHCCLGVLCEIYHQEVGGEWKIDTLGVLGFDVGGRTSATVLPVKVQNWSEMKSVNGYIRAEVDNLRTTDAYILLSELNDKSDKEDFSDIIPYIEKYF